MFLVFRGVHIKIAKAFRLVARVWCCLTQSMAIRYPYTYLCEYESLNPTAAFFSLAASAYLAPAGGVGLQRTAALTTWVCPYLSAILGQLEPRDKPYLLASLNRANLPLLLVQLSDSQSERGSSALVQFALAMS